MIAGKPGASAAPMLVAAGFEGSNPQGLIQQQAGCFALPSVGAHAGRSSGASPKGRGRWGLGQGVCKLAGARERAAPLPGAAAGTGCPCSM